MTRPLTSFLSTGPLPTLALERAQNTKGKVRASEYKRDEGIGQLHLFFVESLSPHASRGDAATLPWRNTFGEAILKKTSYLKGGLGSRRGHIREDWPWRGMVCLMEGVSKIFEVVYDHWPRQVQLALCD